MSLFLQFQQKLQTGAWCILFVFLEDDLV